MIQKLFRNLLNIPNRDEDRGVLQEKIDDAASLLRKTVVYTRRACASLTQAPLGDSLREPHKLPK